MVAFVRDMSFIILSMCLYYHFMEIESLTVTQCIILMVLFVVYIAVVYIQQWYQKKKEKELAETEEA